MSTPQVFRRRVAGPAPDPEWPVIVRTSASEPGPGYVRAHRAEIVSSLAAHGAVLLRGFTVGSPAGLRDIADELAPGELLDYTERSSPRSTVADKVFTATDQPAHQDILLHSENSYQARFPRLVAFWCRRPAASGGATTVADTRQVLDRIPAAIRSQLEVTGVRYVRRFGVGLGLDWPEAFGTRDRARVEEYCRERGLSAEWDGSVLTTTACRPVTLRTPSGTSWFNHVMFFHPRSLPAQIRELMLDQLGRDRLPNDVSYGDGSPIDDETAEVIRSAYEVGQTAVQWQPDDVLLLDNTIAAHGRLHFTGERSVLVSMASSVTWEAVPTWS